MTHDSQDEGPDLSGLVLVGLDLQDPFIRSLTEADRFFRRCSFVLEAARLLDIPVLLTEQVPDKLGPTSEQLTGAAGSPTVFGKTSFSCFGADGLEPLLKEREVRHLLVAGLETPICVYQSVIDAIDKGYEVTLLSDCVGARRADDAAVALRAMNAAGAHVLPAETVIYSILGDTAHPAFRDITALVKRQGHPENS